MAGRERDAGVPDRRGGEDARGEAQGRGDEPGQLRGGYGVFEGADHGSFFVQRLMWMFFRANVLQTLEVATARVYNWDVVQRRKERAEGKEEEEKGRPDG